MDGLFRAVKSFLVNGDPNNNEIEFRFSELGEKHSVSSETFSRVLNAAKQEKEIWQAPIITNNTVIIGKHIVKGNPDVRCIESKTSSIFEQKTRIRTEDREFSNYNMRASEAREKQIEISHADWVKKYIPTLQRTRKRYSFVDVSKIWTLDLTEVETNVDSTKETTFEVELEFQSKSKLIPLSGIQTVFSFTLQSIQNSTLVISNLFGKQLLADYCNLLNINPRYPKFIGPLPFTLTKEIFQSGKLSCGYSVTEKADGDRKLLFVGKQGICLLLSRPKNNELTFQHIGTIPALENSIFDGELVDKQLFLFDTMVFKNVDLREYPLDHRLKVYKKFPNELKCSIEILFKTFYFANEGGIIKIENGIKTENVENSDIYSISQHIWSKRSSFPYKLDGLIYTPILANYYNTNIYKWKDSNTIDFFVEKISDTVWKLFIAGLNEKNEYIHLPFEGGKNDGIFRLRKGKNIEEIKNLIWHSNSPFKTGVINVSKSIAKNFSSNTVIEFKHYGGKLIPTRHRADKKNANNIRAINDAWESIVDSLTISNLKAGVYKSCTRQYHNSIKNILIKQFSSKRKVLEIGSGAGGDIIKYSNAEVKKLIGIDIVDVEYKHPSHMSFFKVTNELYSIRQTIEHCNTGLFDTVNCHFALHYFFKNKETLDNLVRNLDENLKRGGTFVATCMDGEKINKLLNKNQILKGKTLNAKYKSNSIYKIKKNYKNVETINELPIVNQKVEVRLSGTKYFKEQTSIEYLVNIEKFVEFMKLRKYKHVQTTSFAELCKKFPYECQAMNGVEKEFSFLNAYVIFTRD